MIERTHKQKSDDRIDRRDAFRTALIVSGLFWALLIYGVNFDDNFNAKLRTVLGMNRTV